ncbi:alpha/beta-Hydrolases superfamily protein [Quillaja saponaria]|uniref:Alpha/beta-Hydrolases superfamily protein n=1 Tax=Quillaja saponaria TaxID=32244 RepID=A0AAD7VKP6_QUISA|nr:alpha/beta-Hydrolases superfamily protein [Quillaja saponaria]
MAQTAQNPFQQQRIIIPNKQGEQLVGILHETGSAEIVILCHGFAATKDHFIFMNLAAALEKAGLSSFRFDFTGNGESEGSFQYAHFRREVDDIHSVAQYFRGANRLVSAVVGHSKGGNVVLLYASTYQDINIVVNISGRYDVKAGIEERLGKGFMEKIKKDGFLDVKDPGRFDYRVTEESMMDRLNTNIHEACIRINKQCRVLTVHGSADPIIPVEEAFEFDKIIPNHKLQVIEEADHCYTHQQAELTSAVVGFIKEAIQQDKAAAI